jgi:PAS domain S-box-containing protein
MLIKFSASAKLYLLIFITAASLIGLGLYGIDDLKEMNENTRTLYADRVLCMRQLANIRYEYIAEIIPMARNVKDHIFTFSEARKRIQNAEQIINTNWHDYNLSYLTPDEEFLVKQTGLIKNQADKTYENLESILAKKDTLALDGFIQKEFSTEPVPIITKVTQLMELQTRVSKDVYNNNKQIFQSTSKKFILLILLFLAIALSLSFYIIKNIKNLIKDRLKSNKIIKESEEKYRSLIEQASDAIYLVDRKGNFTEVNESMCKMTGYTKEELLQLNVEDIIDPDQLKTDPVIHGYHLPGRSLIRERRLVRKDGTIFDVEINVKQFDDSKMLVIARDVTERKQMEAELREAEIKFRTLAEKSMVGIYITQKEKLVYVNPRFAEIFGYQQQELIDTPGSIIDLIISKEDQALFRKNNQARFAGEIDNANYEFKGQKKDGTENNIEIFGSRVIIDGEPSIIGTMIDITDRKRAEELILKEKQLSDAIINSLPGIFYLRNEKGKLLRWNQSLEIVTGYTAQEIEGLVVRDMILQEDFKIMDMAAEKVHKEGYAMAEAHVKTKDGIIIPFLLTGSPIVFENQLCLIGTGIDILSRIKAEEELRLSEQKYKLLFESNPSPLWMVAKDDLSIIAVNEAAASLYGYTKDELLNSNAAIVRLEEDIDQQKLNFQTAVTGPTDRGITRHIKKDGTIIFVNVIVNDITFEGRIVRLVLTTDITEKLIAEEELRSSEQKYKLLFESNPSPLWMIAKDDLSVIAVNEAVANLYGYTKDEIVNMGVTAFRPAEDLEQQLEGYNVELDGSTDYPIVRHLKKDGAIIFVQTIAHDIIFEGRSVRLSMTNDITERLKAEESLKKSEANLQTILNTTDTAYALFDMELKAQAFNQKAIEFVKHEYYHLPKKGDRLVDFFPTERFPQFVSFTKAVLKGNTINYEINYPQADGSVIWYYVSLFPITNSSKEILGMMMALYDITERKNAEHDLKSAYERIQSHISSIKDMAWKQSHLIRSPLANLKGLAGMLKEDPSDVEVLNFIQNELDRMDTIIIEMGDMSDHHINE